ncbi:uncharacterized protein LOC132263126 [Phlebotomus argentipes]|uniref:uncharacterized protein LOC132263126 n=1 Tax=Phlebotomus argentipes TaxID=94469 RepID=UPI0028930BCE|nr:uncharacterized protein LOC132263126 [Phlebotomus argentipes]
MGDCSVLGREAQSDVNSLINRIFWCCLCFSTAFYLVRKIVQALLRSSSTPRYKWHPTFRHIWNISFFSGSTVFLHFYHKTFIAPEIEKEVRHYFPKYENLLLFMPNEDTTKFNDIFVIVITFHLIAIVLDLRECDYSEAAQRVLFSSVLVIFYIFRYEHYFVLLNISVGLMGIATEVLLLSALHTSTSRDILFILYATFRFITWSYVFLNLMPFKFLLPTLYVKNFNAWLNIFSWLWYGSCVWNSPILQFIYHQTFHIAPIECIGGGNVAKCIMLKDSPDVRHYKTLQKSVLEVKLATEKSNGNAAPAESSSARTFQTIKCMMTLKRKLRRIRENRDGKVKNDDASGEEDAEGSSKVDEDDMREEISSHLQQ